MEEDYATKMHYLAGPCNNLLIEMAGDHGFAATANDDTPLKQKLRRNYRNFQTWGFSQGVFHKPDHQYAFDKRMANTTYMLNFRIRIQDILKIGSEGMSSLFPIVQSSVGPRSSSSGI